MRSRRSPASGASATRPVHQLRALARRERFQEQRRRIQLAASPVRPGIQQLGARDAQKEDRRIAREVRQMLDEVDENGLGPLQIVDHDDLRRVAARASSRRRYASWVSGGEVPIMASGSASLAIRISTSGQ